MFMRYYIVLFFALCTGMLQAQNASWYQYKIQGNEVFLIIDHKHNEAQLDSLYQSCGLLQTELQQYLNSGQPSSKGWYVVSLSKEKASLRKAIDAFNGKPENQKDLIFLLADEIPAQEGYPYGFNTFSKPAVKNLPDGQTMFYLEVEGEPRSVYLSGSFNNWSTLATPLQKNDSGYVAYLNLAEGAHLYKYIVNGYWVLDPRNKTTQTDWMENENSLYFKENHQFKLRGFEDAKKVYVAGSFNNWQEKEIPMRRSAGGWQRSVYLPEGTHSYKFVVDGQWLADPENPAQRADGQGNKNAILAIGDTLYFFYPGALQAENVVVAGDFNGWNEQELKLMRNDSGWTLPYVLPAGNYQYKFLVNGQWHLDPANPARTGEGDFENSLLVVDPNLEFELAGYEDATTVRITGDFNGWDEHGALMHRQSGAWRVKLHLPKGKQRYKFIVDGEWIIDPGNNNWEGNEYGSGNSVVWVP